MLDSNNTQDLFRLDGRVAIITGGAGTLAGEFAKALSDFGAHVVLADVDYEKCAERTAHLTAVTTLESMAVRCDVTSKAEWESLVEVVLTRFRRVDILVNNAAYTNASRSRNYGADFADFPVEDWNQLMAVNLTGAFLGCQVIGRQMLVQGCGSIINIASLYGVVSPSHRMYAGTDVKQPAGYSVSKAGVLALTRYLGTLWAERGVRVNALTPGGIYDGHTNPFLERYSQLAPVGRMAERTEMRGALVYLASDASSYCAGQNLVVDGGWTAW